MKKIFKPHLEKIIRVQGRSGRDLENGLRLDRNERPDNFSDEIIGDIFKNIPPYLFNVYPECEEFYDILSEFSGFSKEFLFLTEGITGGMKVIMETLLVPGDNIVVPSPTYALYPIFSKVFQAEFRQVGYTADLELDVTQLLAQIDKKTKVVFIPNPNQPVETFLPEKVISEIAAKCRRYNAILVIDECYDGYCPTCAGPLISQHDNMVILRTFSKSMGLASIRLGYMISNPENITYFAKTRGIIEMNTFSMYIAAYMMEHKYILLDYIKEVEQSREYVKQELDRFGIKWHGGCYGNFIVIFLKVKERAVGLARELSKNKIYIRGPFTPPFDNCLRITIGSKKIMKKFFTCFAGIYKKYI